MSEPINLKEMKSLLELLQKYGVSEFELERGDEKLALRRGAVGADAADAGPPHIHQVIAPMPSVSQAAAPPVSASAGASPESVQVRKEVAESRGAAVSGPAPVEVSPEVPTTKLIEISSPMVGTFYRRPAVDADPFIEVGDMVKKGSVLCIVEAMKLMNEIEAEVGGKVAEVCLEDGQMVEYGETLFKIEPL